MSTMDTEAVTMDTEAARIRAVVHEWAERVKRGERLPRYGFDRDGRDLREETGNGH